MTPATARVRWRRAFRLINSQHPPIDLFDQVADPADWESLIELEMMTNPRCRELYGDISIVPVDERVHGENASWVMAAFCHHDKPSRFATADFGAYYAARDFRTALLETVFHTEAFLDATSEPIGTVFTLRQLVGAIDCVFHDIRGGYPAEHDPNSYGASHALATALRDEGSNGIAYDSVRHPGGHCVAAFRPKAVRIPQQGAHVRLHWDGARVDRWMLNTDEGWTTL